MNTEKTKTTVIFHSADFDGLFCREIARKFMPDAEFIGWDFKDAPLPFPASERIYVMDLPIDRVFGFEFHGNDMFVVGKKAGTIGDYKHITWIDHHKSAIESHPKDIPGYRIDGVAACRLAWQWFNESHKMEQRRNIGLPPLPLKEEFTHRKVSEPLAVRLAGEYDIWDKRDPDAELFQHALRTKQLNELDWFEMLNTNLPGVPTIALKLMENARVLQFARDNEYRDVITDQGFDVEFEGIKFLACNSHECDIRSQLFEAGIKPHHEALLGFTYTGKPGDKAWRVSMYHIDGRGQQPDILAIAKKYDGGGHPGACGCHLPTLPFLP